MTSYIEQLPEELWRKVIDHFAVETTRTIDFLPEFEIRGNRARLNRQTLCALSLTCKALTESSQAVLFRHAFPPSDKHSIVEIVRYDEAGQQALYGALSGGKGSLRAAIHSIALDLALDVDYDTLVAGMPNLEYVEIYASSAKPAAPRYLQLSSLFLRHARLTHIKVRLIYNTVNWAEELLYLCVPSGFRGHLSIHHLDLLYLDRGPAEQCKYPSLSSLFLDTPYMDGIDLPHLVGKGGGMNMRTLAINNAVENPWDGTPLVAFFAASLRELVYIDYTSRHVLPIEGFQNLCKLTVSGCTLTGWEIDGGPREGAASMRGTVASQSNLAGRLPTTIETLQIVLPCLDVYAAVHGTILPRLHQLRRLVLELTMWDDRSSDVVGYLGYNTSQEDDSECPTRSKALQEAGTLDTACRARGIVTEPASFRIDLSDTLCAVDTQLH